MLALSHAFYQNIQERDETEENKETVDKTVFYRFYRHQRLDDEFRRKFHITRYSENAEKENFVKIKRTKQF